MFGLLARALEFFYGYWHSYAGAIALLTILVMLIVTPLTLKGTRSMMMMQLVQPEMKRLQAQYKDDRQKLNEELLKFYKENNINPLSGCLPLLIQLPVFFVLYRVLAGLTHTAVVNGQQVFEPKYLKPGSDLYDSLFHKREMLSAGMDLSISATKAMSDSFGKAIPYLVMVVLVAITSFVQQKQISGRNPAGAQNPQQQLIMKLGPIMITFFSLIVPAGLTVYFLVSNLFRVGQQELISRTIYRSPEAARLREIQEKQAADRGKKATSGPPKGFFERFLGDAAPRVGDRKPTGNGTSRSKKDARSGSGTGSTRRASAPEPSAGAERSSGAGRPGGTGPKPPPARNNGGRVTPPGNRPASARRKKKRK
jgi:YidC/Oxa1 family membrane protein insertase